MLSFGVSFLTFKDLSVLRLGVSQCYVMRVSQC